MAFKFPAPVADDTILAKWHGGPQIPKCVRIHGTVTHDDPGTAVQVGRMFQTTTRKASAHYIVDPKTIIQSVWDHTVSFDCGYNTGGISVELCDEQVGPASRWDDADSRAILRKAARLTAQICLAYNIEIRRPSIAELKAKGPHGIYGHNDSRLAFGNTTHTDPRDFDWPEFIAMVKAEADAIRKAATQGGAPKPAPKPTTKPKPAPAKKPLLVNMAHASMQYNDTEPQWKKNAERIFTRKYDWITGTEAGEDPGKSVLAAAAKKYGYHFIQYKSNWVAIHNSAIVDGSYTTSQKTVVLNDYVVGPGHDLNIVGAHFEHPVFGKINVFSTHYATKGRPDGKGIWSRNLKPNQTLAHALGDMADKHGAGSALVFVGADTNIIDKTNDVFFGEDLTTAWDELKRWEDTGHGNIDIIASYDKDLRVSAEYVRALDDKELPLYTDHFLVEAGYWIRPL